MGCYFSEEELSRLCAWAAQRGCWILSDEIFGLLSLGEGAGETVASPAARSGGAKVAILGGLSKELAAGGLRVGWLATHDDELAALVRRIRLAPVHLAATRAASQLYAAWGRDAAGEPIHPQRLELLQGYMASMRRRLAEKRAAIAEAFAGAGPSEGCEPGGLFLAPRVDNWLGKKAGGERITPEDLPRILYEHTSVVVNGGPWCGDLERVRVVFAIPDEALREAARRIEAFGRSLR
jgi:aspartate/methionine/tyrosine aminotransferase